jgi:uncharacterized protein (TIGR03435 family)
MNVVRVSELIAFAYQRDPLLPRDIPWIFDFYDLIAKTPAPSTIDQQRVMLQTALAERFKLKFHIETKEGQVLALVLGPKPHLEESKEEGEFGIRIRVTPDLVWDLISGRRMSMRDLARYLSSGGKPVIDKTGLTGRYDFTDAKALEDHIPPLDVEVPAGGQRLSGLPTEVRNEAIVKHLGLRLEPQRGPIETFVIDHIQKPTEN